MRILILEDDATSRIYAQRLIENSQEFGHLGRNLAIHTIDEYPKSGIAPICMEIARIDQEERTPYYSSNIDVVVLDLHLGQSLWDGFQVVKAIQHCFGSCRFVINSSQHTDEATQKEAKRLGIRFGNTKNSDQLPALIEAAYETAVIRGLTVSLAMRWLQRPLTPCEGSTNELHVELLQDALKFGLAYTGAHEDVKYELLDRISSLGKDCYDAAHKAHFGFARQRQEESSNRDNDYFENSYTVLCFLSSLKERVKKSIAVTDPLVSYR